MRMFRVRLEATQEAFDEIEEAATVTIEHVAEKVKVLTEMYPNAGPARSKFNAQLTVAMGITDDDIRAVEPSYGRVVSIS